MALLWQIWQFDSDGDAFPVSIEEPKDFDAKVLEFQRENAVIGECMRCGEDVLRKDSEISMGRLMHWTCCR